MEVIPNSEGDFAPVAEYKGVAILERGGIRPAIWRNVEYSTDGKYYLLMKAKSREGGRITVKLNSEREAKDVLDLMSPQERSGYANFKEAFNMLGSNWPKKTPRYIFDEERQQFVLD